MLVDGVHLRERQDHHADQPALRYRQLEKGFKNVAVLVAHAAFSAGAALFHPLRHLAAKVQWLRRHARPLGQHQHSAECARFRVAYLHQSFFWGIDALNTTA